ncbi:MAG: hypothetical protein IPK74_02190 [Deltaproteobacteria bacterium]|nr:hypothetical protein [Deltaproteobacteria bacterium]
MSRYLRHSLFVLGLGCNSTAAEPQGAESGTASAGAASTDGTGASTMLSTMSAGDSGDDAAEASSVGPLDETGPAPDVPASCRAFVPPTATPPMLEPGRWTDLSPPGLHRPYGEAPPFGCMDIHVLPCAPSTLYLTTDSEGMWRSTDGGASWSTIGDLPEPVSPGVMEIDPADAQHMVYVGGVRGSSLGFWISNDGGDTWSTPTGFAEHADNSIGGWTNDVYHVAADPTDFDHLLLTFHSGFEFTGDAGVLESHDGGQSWTRHDAMPGWGAGHSIWFVGDADTWLLGTQGDGYWRTADAGASWTQVIELDMQHGGVAAYYASNGVLYVGALGQILRSEDDGLSFDLVGPATSDGYYAVIGDGTTLYAQLANTGGNTTGPQPFVVSPESDGFEWTVYNEQTFSDGPYRMAFDPVHRIVYASSWNEGVWALAVP